MSAEPALAEDPAFQEDEETQVHAASLVLRLRGMGIADVEVLRAMETVPRTLFVRPELRHRAYAEHALPIDCGQSIPPPSLVGAITAALDLSDRHGVLDVGTGSGYHAAVLAQLSRRVTTIERFRTLSRAAEGALSRRSASATSARSSAMACSAGGHRRRLTASWSARRAPSRRSSSSCSSPTAAS